MPHYSRLLANPESARTHEFPNGIDGLLHRNQVALRIAGGEFFFLRASGPHDGPLEGEGKTEVETAGAVFDDLVRDRPHFNSLGAQKLHFRLRIKDQALGQLHAPKNDVALDAVLELPGNLAFGHQMDEGFGVISLHQEPFPDVVPREHGITGLEIRIHRHALVDAEHNVGKIRRSAWGWQCRVRKYVHLRYGWNTYRSAMIIRRFPPSVPHD